MPDKPLNVCLLGATFGTGNLGVGALTAGTIQCILHRFPLASISLLDYGTQHSPCVFRLADRQVPLRLVSMRFSKRFYLRNNIARLILLALAIRIIPFSTIRCRLARRNVYLRHIQEADIVASLAGGDSFSDVYGLARLLYVSLPQLLVLFLGRKLVLLPQTLGPFRGWLAQAIGKYILNRAELIYSRDAEGLSRMEALLGPRHRSGKVRFCYDVGFVIDPVAPRRLDLLGLPDNSKPNSSIVGLNISGLLLSGDYPQNNIFGLRIDYREFIERLIPLLIEEKMAHVILIPHVFGGAANTESDSRACEMIYGASQDKYQDRIGFVRGSYDQNEIKYVIGLCDFFVGSRMHACIAALSQNIPAVAIAYSDKFSGVMRTVGVEALVADARKLGTQGILNHIDQAYERRHAIRASLELRMPGIKETVLNLFGRVR